MSETLNNENFPNLDAMIDPQDVWQVWQEIRGGVRPMRVARAIFPDRPKGYVKATRQLGNYAANKATAMRCRLEGRISVALQYESICDRIYSTLPDYAKLW